MLRLALGALLLACLAAPAAAEYPERPVTMMTGYPAGGMVDITARPLVEGMKKKFPKGLAIVNRPGAGGSIAVAEVAQAKPDGYTLGLGAVAILTVQPHLTALPYRTPDDYLAVMQAVTFQVVLFVRSEALWKTAKELLEYARANPGKVRVGVPGIGTILHLDLEHLKLLAKVDMTVVPFEGPQQIAALLGGHVDVALAHPPPVVPHVKAGKIRVIGVFQESRNRLFPEAPTFKELGYDVTLGVYNLLVAPKGSPAPVVQTIHDAFRKALAEPSFGALAQKSQFDIEYASGEAVTRELWASFEQNGKLVELLGLKKK